MTHKLSPKQYPSPYHFDREEIIRQMVNKEEAFIDTVVNLKGVAGKPIYQPVEWRIQND